MINGPDKSVGDTMVSASVRVRDGILLTHTLTSGQERLDAPSIPEVAAACGSLRIHITACQGKIAKETLELSLGAIKNQ